MTTTVAPTTFPVLLVHATLTSRALRRLDTAQRRRIGHGARDALITATDERTQLLAMRVLDLIEGAPNLPGERQSFHRGNQDRASRSMRGERTTCATTAEIAAWAAEA